MTAATIVPAVYAALVTVALVVVLLWRPGCGRSRAARRRRYVIPMPDRCPAGMEPRCVPSADPWMQRHLPRCTLQKPVRIGYLTYGDETYDVLMRKHCSSRGISSWRRQYWDVFARRHRRSRWFRRRGPLLLLRERVSECPYHNTTLPWWRSRSRDHGDAHLNSNDHEDPVFYADADGVNAQALGCGR